MFTIKYRAYNPVGVASYEAVEQLHGPFYLVSQEHERGSPVVYGYSDPEGLPMTFGPARRDPETPETPTPIVWVMNERGATVATYHL